MNKSGNPLPVTPASGLTDQQMINPDTQQMMASPGSVKFISKIKYH